jgi:hypothetical protein
VQLQQLVIVGSLLALNALLPHVHALCRPYVLSAPTPARSAVLFSLTATSSGKAVGTRVCAGDSYSLHVDFGAPSVRNYLLTASAGTLAATRNDCDPLWWCVRRGRVRARRVRQQAWRAAAGARVSPAMTNSLTPHHPRNVSLLPAAHATQPEPRVLGGAGSARHSAAQPAL